MAKKTTKKKAELFAAHEKQLHSLPDRYAPFCKHCKHYRVRSDEVMVCMLYPKWEEHPKNHCCGQFESHDLTDLVWKYKSEAWELWFLWGRENEIVHRRDATIRKLRKKLKLLEKQYGKEEDNKEG